MAIIGPFKGMRGHKAEALVVHCLDFRFQEAFAKFLKLRNFAGCDIVSVAGGVKDWSQVEKQVEIAVKLHEVDKVILINHRHCGAYGEDLQINPQEEFEKHKQDLKETAQKIMEKYPQLLVETWFAEMKPRKNSLVITFFQV